MSSTSTTAWTFLGCNVRRYHGKLLIKPSKTAVRRVRERLADEMRRLRGANAPAVLGTIAPIVRGWATCYRGVVSKAVFAALDDHMWRLDRKPSSPREWEQWLTGTRKAIGKRNLIAHRRDRPPDDTRLVHVSCYRRTTGAPQVPECLHT